MMSLRIRNQTGLARAVTFAGLAGLAVSVLWGQPFVKNGGFESFSELPDASGQLDLVIDWAGGGSEEAIPDFYHEQGTNGGDLPQTPLAVVEAFAGRAVAGFVAYTDEQNPRHEYLTGTFSEPLVVGQRYKMSFAITSGLVHDWVSAGMGVSGLSRPLNFESRKPFTSARGSKLPSSSRQQANSQRLRLACSIRMKFV